MRDEIRVPPDRRGEVRVVRKRESEVSLRAGRIHRLLHGAEQLPAQERRLGPGLDAGKQPGAVGRTKQLRGNSEPFAKAGQQVLEGIDPGLVGGRVNPVKRRSLGASQPFGDRLVREQHEILDEPVGVVPFRVAGVQQVPLGIGGHQRLGQIEVYGSAFRTRPGKQRSSAPHGPDGRSDGTRIGAGQEARAVLIRQPGDAPDHPAKEAGFQQPSVRADPQARRLNQPVHAGEERANPRRQGLRQHRHGALGEVDRGPPQGGLPVHRASRRDVVADVRDVNPDLEAAVRQLGRLDRIVVVPGVLGIDGENQPAAEILAGPEFAGGDRRGRGLRLGERCRRERITDRVLRKDRTQFRPRLVGGTEDARHLADDGLPGGRITPDTHFDEISGLRPACREQDLARPTAVPDGDRAFGCHQPDERRGAPLDDPDDGPLEPSAPGAERRLDVHEIARQRPTQAAAGDVDVFPAVRRLRDHPSVTLRTALEASPDQARGRT